MILVTFALPDESAAFRRRLRRPIRQPGAGLSSYAGWLGTKEIVVLHTGVGRAAAERSMRELLVPDRERPECVVVSGFAGGLVTELRIGDIVLGSNLSDAALLARCGGDAVAQGKLCSVPSVVETVQAKRELARTTGAIAVDMETEFIHAACQQAGVPCLSARAISDTAGDDLPVPFLVWFDPERQRPKIAGLLAFLATHPSRIPPFARFVRNVSRAKARLGEFLADQIPRL